MVAQQNFKHKNFIIRIIVTPIAVALVMLSCPTFSEDLHTQNASRVISWQDADKHYGEYAAVEGKIVATLNSGKACFLNFHPNYKKYFTAVIFASAFSLFPANPENFYYGKKVRVSGYIKEYKGKPEIILNDPSQIEILE